jgi:hypothetical protein
VISSPNKVQSYDIDAPDAHNELAVVEYVDDIYSFYKSTEVRCCLRPVFIRFFYGKIADCCIFACVECLPTSQQLHEQTDRDQRKNESYPY